MENSERQLSCIACNKVQTTNDDSCECGHVMREAVNLQNRSSRKRKAPYRPNSISSEWIGLSEKTHVKPPTAKKPKPIAELKNSHNNNNNNNHVHIPRKTNKKSNNKTLPKIKAAIKTMQCNDLRTTTKNRNGDHLHPPFDDQENNCTELKDLSSKKEQAKQLLKVIESSYQNAYFNRCKSYRKAKITDITFEFDFSTFDSHNPDYPSALEDINTKITRTNSFWQSVNSENA